MTLFTTFERLMAHIQGLEGMLFRFDGDEKSSPGRYKVCQVQGENVVCQRLDPLPGPPLSSRASVIRYFSLSDPIILESTTTPQEVAP